MPVCKSVMTDEPHAKSEPHLSLFGPQTRSLKLNSGSRQLPSTAVFFWLQKCAVASHRSSFRNSPSPFHRHLLCPKPIASFCVQAVGSQLRPQSAGNAHMRSVYILVLVCTALRCAAASNSTSPDLPTTVDATYSDKFSVWPPQPWQLGIYAVAALIFFIGSGGGSGIGAVGVPSFTLIGNLNPEEAVALMIAPLVGVAIVSIIILWREVCFGNWRNPWGKAKALRHLCLCGIGTHRNLRAC